MNKIFLNILAVFAFTTLLSCQTGSIDDSREIKVISSFSELQSTIDKSEDKLLILNFWATSCPPCIKEMPHFNELWNKYDKADLQIILVSLDEIKYLETRVEPFVEKHKLKPEVCLLQDQNYSAWTDKIDASWYGALPATLIVKGDERNFRFGIYESFIDLESDVFKIDPSLAK